MQHCYAESLEIICILGDFKEAMFCVRLVISQSDRSVTRQEAKAAVGFSFCGSSLFYVLHCYSSSHGRVFSRILFFSFKISNHLPQALLLSLSLFSGVIFFPF
jgi:hypothetical protein